MKKSFCLLLFFLMTVGVSAIKADTVPTVEQVVLVNAAVRTELLELPTAQITTRTVEALDSMPIEVHFQFTSPQYGESFWAWALKNWVALLGALLLVGEIIVRWTPTAKDNANLQWLRNLFDSIFGNAKLGGGNFI